MATSIGRINGIQSRRPLPPTKALHIFLLLRTYFITNPWYENKIFLNDFAIVNSDFVKENEVLEIKVFLKKRNTLNEQNRRELQFWTWFCQESLRNSAQQTNDPRDGLHLGGTNSCIHLSS